MSNARNEIVRLIAANAAGFQPEQIEALFVVTAEDLAAGGVNRIRVQASMMRAWVQMQLTTRSAFEVADLLRDFADRLERPSINSQSGSRNN